MAEAAPDAAEKSERTPLRTVVIASSAGTAFEWYDFFVYGSLTKLFSNKFFNAAEISRSVPVRAESPAFIEVMVAALISSRSILNVLSWQSLSLAPRGEKE